MMDHSKLAVIALAFVLCAGMVLGVMTAGAASAAGFWRDESNRSFLKNAAIEAKFQSGMLYELKDAVTGKFLVSIDPGQLPSQLVIFDKTVSNLDGAEVSVKAARNSVTATYTLVDGNQLTLKWSMESGKSDLILNASSRTAKPLEQIRYTLFGCDITNYAMVWINAYGASHVVHSPWNEVFLGDPQKDDIPSANPQPPVALFQGDKAGWFVEGRDPRTGPSNLLVKGYGDTVQAGMVRRYPIPVKDPELFEVRIRTYSGIWENAVDPYVEWLEKGAGFVPISKLPATQAWVQGLETQSYIPVGDFENLEALAKLVDPARTFVGRQAEHRNYAFDVGYPDYRLTDTAKKWVKRARELGFHVGVHYNSNAVGTEFPELIDRFRPGFNVIGKDASGNDTYESLYNGKLIRVSPAYKPWRDYLIQQMKDAVDAGVDVIYLDESMTAVGKYIVDGVNGLEGMTALMKETLEAYPHVAVQNEQFNLLTARYGKIALSQMPLGHPLSGYLYRRYVKVVPEGVMTRPIESPLMDAFDYWGYMLPSSTGDPADTWTQICMAYHKYNLQPDSRLPRKEITNYAYHPTSGVIPVDNDPVPAEGVKLFGFKGTGGVTAYLEKHPTKRGLVVYEPGKQPQWVGTRHFNVKSYKGPGVPSYIDFRQNMKDWLIYNNDSLLGLDPQVTYMFDASVERKPDRFHVTKVPDDFIGYRDGNRRIAPQEVGTDDSFFRLVFGGHGQIEMYVPDEYDVYLDGQKLTVDRASKTAKAMISASLPKAGSPGYFIALSPEGKPKEAANTDRPSMLLAFKRTDTELTGEWTKLSWQGSKDIAKYAAQGATSVTVNVGAFIVFVGKLPQAKSIRLEGSYIVSTTTGGPGDGVVLINGKQVLRVPAGDYPYTAHDFSTDISQYAGQYVLIEAISDGDVRGSQANWMNPRFVVEK